MRKYRNKKCSCEFQHETYHFDSKAEMDYFLILANKLRTFKIDKLKLQPKFQLSEPFTINTNKTKSGKSRMQAMIYTPDFEYIENGKKVVVEVKGMITKDYRMRLKLFLSSAYKEHGVNTFIEVINGNETVYDCTSV
jgi:predicted nuclease of restriction endonuclease-like RecB superfamily